MLLLDTGALRARIVMQTREQQASSENELLPMIYLLVLASMIDLSVLVETTMPEPYCPNHECGTRISPADGSAGVCSQWGTPLLMDSIANPIQADQALARVTGSDWDLGKALKAAMPWNWDWAGLRSKEVEE